MSAATVAAGTGAVLRRRRSRVAGIGLLALAGVMTWLFALGADDGASSKLEFNSFFQKAVHVPTLSVAERPAVFVLAGICAALGVTQLIRGFGRRTGIAVGVAIVCFVFAFLLWAARGSSLNVTGALSSTLLRSVPITLGALSGIVCERAGVINIAIEGQMLLSAFTSTIISSATGSVWLGLVAGVLTGGLVGWLLAVLSIRYRVDQIIAGFALVILATGVTNYLFVTVLQNSQSLNSSSLVPNLTIPLLSKIPVLGPVLFNTNLFVWFMIVLIVVVHVALYHMRWGLRVRAVGEHPKAADTLGIDPLRIRYVNVVLGGMLAGLGGAYFTLGSVGSFNQNMTGGRGFISLVAVIFGGWNPVPAFLAALVFGFADTLQTILGALNSRIPPDFLVMAPYLATIVVVALLVGRTRAPAADGQPYVKE